MDMSGKLEELLRDVLHKFPPSLWDEVRALAKKAYDAAGDAEGAVEVNVDEDDKVDPTEPAAS